VQHQDQARARQKRGSRIAANIAKLPACCSTGVGLPALGRIQFIDDRSTALKILSDIFIFPSSCASFAPICSDRAALASYPASVEPQFQAPNLYRERISISVPQSDTARSFLQNND
jgi:hypothetical protein